MTIHLRPMLVAGCLLLLLHGSAVAQSTIEPGFDYHRTVPGASFLDFAVEPIPADFFGPGSDPFTGFVPLQGIPLLTLPSCPGDDLTQVDTIIDRQAAASLPNVGSEDTIPIEIVSMSLESVAPITVTFGGGKRARQFFVKIDPAPSPPSRQDVLLQKISENVTRANSVFAIWLTLGFFEVEAPSAPPLELGRSYDLQPTRYRMFSVVDRASPKRTCTSNVCANEDLPGFLDAPGLHLEIEGICPEPPVSARSDSWGRIKLRFDGARD